MLINGLTVIREISTKLKVNFNLFCYFFMHFAYQEAGIRENAILEVLRSYFVF